MQGFPDHAIRGLLLAGGGARLGGLPAMLEAELDIPVARLDSVSGDERLQWQKPMSGMRVEPHTAASIGGALLGLEA
jgi:Tfp pilus assembly PilM family ATPase